MPRALILTCLLLSLGAASVGAAQSALDRMTSNLNEGFYSVAAQVDGPALVQERPDDPEAHYFYSNALYLTGNIAQARTELDAALALGPPADDYRYHLLNGLLRAAEGDSEGAERLLRATFVRAQTYEVATAWGRVAWQSGDYEEALEAYTAAAATPEGGREVWAQLNRGRMFKALGRFEEAVEAFQASIQIFIANDPGGNAPPSPGYIEAFFRLGELYEAQGDLKSAEAQYKAARGADPNYAPAIAALDRLARSSP